MMEQKVRKSLHWLLPCMLVLMVGVVCAEDFVVKNSNGNTIERWKDGELVWTSTSNVSGIALMDIGPDGNVYASTSNNQDTRVWDGATGEYLGLAPENVGHRLYGICFGPDIDADGIKDQYIFGGDNQGVKSFTSSSGYTEQGSWEVTIDTITTVENATGAWIGNWGPDVTGDGFPELYLMEKLDQSTTNELLVIDGANPSVVVNTWSVGSGPANRPGCLVGGTDGRIYLTGRAGHEIVSWLPDGTDQVTNLVGNTYLNFPTQISEGRPGEWIIVNRFAITGETGASILGSTDNLATVTTLLNYGDDTADSWGCGTTYEGGLPGRGQAYGETPIDFHGGVDSTVVSSVSWDAPADSNFVVTGYDVYWGVDSEPNYAAAPAYSGTEQSFTPTGDDAIGYESVYVWRVDTHVTWDSNDITGSLDDVIEGRQWYFVTKPAYIEPTVTFKGVITTLDLLPATLSATIENNTATIQTAEFTCADSNATVTNTTVDPQSPTAELTTTVGGTYEVVLTVFDGTTTDIKTADVEVYASACDAAKATGERVANPYDFNNDCYVDLLDFAAVAEQWLDSTVLTGQFNL